MENAVATQNPAQLAALVKEILAGDAQSAQELLQSAAEAAMNGTRPAATNESAVVAVPEPPTAKDTWLTLPGLSLAAPKGRFDISVSSEGLTLRGKAKGCASLGPVAWHSITSLLKLPKQEGSRKAGAPARIYLIVMPLSEPIVVGKQEHHCVVVNSDGAKPLPSMPVVADGNHPVRDRLAEVLDEFKRQDTQLPEHEVLLRLFQASLDVKATEPEPEVCSLEAVQAWKGVEEGTLYPLRSGLCFLPKPATFIPAEDILSAEAGTGGGPRGGELVVHRVSNGKKADTYSNVSRGDMHLLLAYLKKLVTQRDPGGLEAQADDDEDDEDFEDDAPEAAPPVPQRARTRSQVQAARVGLQGQPSSSSAPPAKRKRQVDARGDSTGCNEMKNETAELIEEVKPLPGSVATFDLDEEDDDDAEMAEDEEEEEEHDEEDDDVVVEGQQA